MLFECVPFSRSNFTQFLVKHVRTSVRKFSASTVGPSALHRHLHSVILSTAIGWQAPPRRNPSWHSYLGALRHVMSVASTKSNATFRGQKAETLMRLESHLVKDALVLDYIATSQNLYKAFWKKGLWKIMTGEVMLRDASTF